MNKTKRDWHQKNKKKNENDFYTFVHTSILWK